MDIERLHKEGLLSIRAMNVCRRNKLLNLHSIREYFLQQNSFINLPSCGVQVQKELLALCEPIAGGRDPLCDVRLRNPLNTEVEELAEIHKYTTSRFSRQTVLVCKVNNLHSVGDILAHFEKFRTFNNLTKSGAFATAELSSICHDYQIKYAQYQDLIKAGKNDNNVNYKKHKLSDINNFIQMSLKGLTIRSKNVICHYLDDNLDYLNFKKQIFSNTEFDISHLKNIGLKSTEEIRKVLAAIKEFGQSQVEQSESRDGNHLKSDGDHLAPKIANLKSLPNKQLDLFPLQQLKFFDAG